MKEELEAQIQSHQTQLEECRVKSEIDSQSLLNEVAKLKEEMTLQSSEMSALIYRMNRPKLSMETQTDLEFSQRHTETVNQLQLETYKLELSLKESETKEQKANLNNLLVDLENNSALSRENVRSDSRARLKIVEKS